MTVIANFQFISLCHIAFYCDLINARSLPRFVHCDQRTVMRMSAIKVLLLYKYTVTYI
jgi:hypothetical protein